MSRHTHPVSTRDYKDKQVKPIPTGVSNITVCAYKDILFNCNLKFI